MTEEKTCFVISPIGPEGSETRERSDKLLDHVVKKSVSGLGYKAIRADEIDEPGQITTQIIQRVIESELVIADLTDQNPNVFYELAIRHAVEKPIIQIIDEGEDIPFDIHNQRTIHIDLEDLDSVEDAKEQIQNQIESLEKDEADVETPLSMAMNLQFWEDSSDPEQRDLAEVVEIITEMRSDVDQINSKLDSHSELPGINDSDREDIMEIYNRCDEMEKDLQTLNDIVEPIEFHSEDEQMAVNRAIDYLDHSIRLIRQKTNSFLKKYN